jgi:cellulose synthase/poly-beta-1,6-N-acetylglucosamine synthase-like glycosyltransferase
MGRRECRLRFSIVIPAYNEEAFIGATLRSLLAQDFADPYEIIVVDNNSKDWLGYNTYATQGGHEPLVTAVVPASGG